MDYLYLRTIAIITCRWRSHHINTRMQRPADIAFDPVSAKQILVRYGGYVSMYPLTDVNFNYINVLTFNGDGLTFLSILT